MVTTGLYLADATTALREHWDLDANVTPAPGEYDMNFIVDALDGRRFVLKVMREGCDPAFVDMLVGAHAHARANGAQDAIPEVIGTRDGQKAASVKLAGGAPRIAWLLEHLPGVLMAQIEPLTISDAASVGALVGRVNRALETFDHPMLGREHKWDLRRAGWIAGRLDAFADPRRRARIAAVVRRFNDEIASRLSAAPATPLHNDANDMNILFTGSRAARRATGLFDFGDMVRAPRVCDAAIATAYAMMGPGDPAARAGALAAAFNQHAPLTDEEIELLPALTEMRLAVSVTNAAIEAAERPGVEYLQISAAPAWRLLDYLERVGADDFAETVRAAFHGAAPETTSKSLIARRRGVTLANQKLFYNEPLRIVRGHRHFLYDANGAEYLDVYNNVPHVGHANPHVAAAVSRQLSLVNTNSRYLQDVCVEYAERMLSRMPPSLTRIAFVNSASEANEIALRLARAATGARDMIVMEHCYHGATTGAMDISPYKFNHPASLTAKPEWVHVAPQPDPYRGEHGDSARGYVDAVELLLQKIDAEGRRVAGFISEALPSVGGQIVPPDDYLATVYAAVRRAGGVVIADDVQTGLGRLGRWFWGFEQQGAIPDIVVLGKPLGNGYPLAAVAMTDEIASAFERGPEFFSTFGGSSASCAAGAAVLDVLRDENLPAEADRVGSLLRAGLQDLALRYEIIGDIRGHGFFLGVDLVEDRETRKPATAAAAQIKNLLRERRVLCGTEGPADNVLKIRPPMTFDAAAAARLLEALDGTLREVRS